MELPSTFEMDRFISLIEQRQGKFDIRVRQAWGTLFVLDMVETYHYLKGTKGKQGKEPQDLRDFIDKSVLKLNHWHKCVRECDPSQDLLVSD